MKKRALQPRNQRVSSRKQRKQQHLLDVKVRSRAASRQRNRRVLAWLSLVLLVCCAVGGVIYGGRAALRKFFLDNPEYSLAEVRIHTDGPLTRAQILDATHIEEGKNIFRIDLPAARKGLMALAQVDRAEVERILPNKISIDITERKPVAWVTGNDGDNPSSDPGAFLIDRDGILMRMKEQVPAYYHLPVICGLDVNNHEAGDTVDQPEVNAALELIRLTGENPARYQVRSIDVSKGYCLVVTDERHAKITFPIENLQEQLDRLGLVLANVDESGRELQTVNLLVERNVPVTFAPPPQPEADSAAPQASPSPSAAVETQPATDAASLKSEFVSTTKSSAKRAQTTHRSGHHQHSYTVRRAIPLTPFNAEQP